MRAGINCVRLLAGALSIQLSNPVLPWLAKVCFCSCAWVLTLRVDAGVTAWRQVNGVAGGGGAQVQGIGAAGIPDAGIKRAGAVLVGVVAGLRGAVGTINGLQRGDVVHHEAIGVDLLVDYIGAGAAGGKYRNQVLVVGVRHHRVDVVVVTAVGRVTPSLNGASGPVHGKFVGDGQLAVSACAQSGGVDAGVDEHVTTIAGVVPGK